MRARESRESTGDSIVISIDVGWLLVAWLLVAWLLVVLLTH